LWTVAILTPTLTIADNADGTGAVATIAGELGATHAVHVAGWPGSSFAEAGSRVSDGVVALEVPPGPHWAYVLSILGEQSAVSAMAHFRATDGTKSVLDRCLSAVREVIAGLALDGFTADQVKVQKFPWNTSGASEGIFVCMPVPETNKPSSNLRNELGYPVQVVVCHASNNHLTSDIDKHTLWREQIRKAFDFQPLFGVPEVQYCQVEPGVVYDWTMFSQGMYDVQSLIVRCISREPLGVA
jgi:hypothetical protein